VRLKQPRLHEAVQALVRDVRDELVRPVWPRSAVARAEQVGDCEERAEVVAAQLLVDVLDRSRDEERSERLREDVAVVRHVVRVEEDGRELLLDHLRAAAKQGLERGRAHAEELGDDVEHIRVAHDHRARVARAVVDEVDVPEVQNCREQLVRLRDVPLREPDGLERLLVLLEPHRVPVAGAVSWEGRARAGLRPEVTVRALVCEVRVHGPKLHSPAAHPRCERARGSSRVS
jgi:hypothetical protein